MSKKNRKNRNNQKTQNQTVRVNWELSEDVEALASLSELPEDFDLTVFIRETDGQNLYLSADAAFLYNFLWDTWELILETRDAVQLPLL